MENRIEQPATTGSDITGGSTDNRYGLLLVLASAIVWSLGGVLSRFLTTDDNWAIVFWRSIWAALFLFCFMLARDGRRGTMQLFANMGLPGIGVGACFATASTCFIVALAHTTVANILLIQAGTPLFAVLLLWILFREHVTGPTWIAIIIVILGVAVMVSDSFGGNVSPIGDSLSLLIAFAFASATVITRRFAHVRMAPAVCLGMLLAASVSGTLANSLQVTSYDMGVLILFGTVNLGLGMAFFVTGARLIPPELTALVGIMEIVLGPIWVWLVHNEIPSFRTIVGGLIVLFALFGHIFWKIYCRNKRMRNVPPLLF